jgi:hypothetical protein
MTSRPYTISATARLPRRIGLNRVPGALQTLAAGLLLAMAVSCSSGDSGPGRVAPNFTLHPVSQTVTAGNPVTFTVAAGGDPAPTYQWQTSPDGSTWATINGATSASFTFTTQVADDGSRFRAVANNGIGSPAISNAATLTVPGAAPLITTHPQSQTVNDGVSVTFTVAASGTPAPTLQWQRSADGTTWAPIGGATLTTYTFTAQVADDGAQFRAVADNGIGSPATSNSAILTVQGTVSVTLTQSVSQSIVADNSVSCNSAGYHADNSYWRVFDLGTFGITTAFTVNEVQFGIEQATATSGTQPIIVNLYTLNDTFTLAHLTLLGTATVSVSDQAQAIFPAAVAGTVPAGSKLVVEINTPSGQPNVATFFIGSNGLGQSGPSYLSATDCGVSEPTNTEAIGFPSMQIVLNVVGTVE